MSDSISLFFLVCISKNLYSYREITLVLDVNEAIDKLRCSVFVINDL